MKKKNNVLTIVILIAIAILLVTVIASVFNFSPKMKEYTYGEMVQAFERNEVFGYINTVLCELEICCRETEDFKGAYNYANDKMQLLEHMLSEI